MAAGLHKVERIPSRLARTNASTRPKMLSRLRKLGARAALAGALALSASTAALAQGTLRIGMTASDIPLTTG